MKIIFVMFFVVVVLFLMENYIVASLLNWSISAAVIFVHEKVPSCKVSWDASTEQLICFCKTKDG